MTTFQTIQLHRFLGPQDRMGTERLRREKYRFETFATWPYGHFIAPSPADMARAGFYYYNKGSQVQCGFCYTILTSWAEGHNPVARHKQQSLGCPFLAYKNEGNIPMHPVTGEELPLDHPLNMPMTIFNLKLANQSQIPTESSGAIYFYGHF